MIPRAATSARRSSRSPRRAGFTLLELVLAIVIVGAIGMLAFASLDPLRRAERRRTAEVTIDAAVSEARVTAMRLGEPVSVRLDAAGDGVWIVRGTGTVGFDDAAGASRSSDSGEDVLPAILERMTIDGSVRVTLRRPEWVPSSLELGGGSWIVEGEDDAFGGEGFGTLPGEAAGFDPASFEVDAASGPGPVLVVFLPDGAVLTAVDAWLMSDGSAPRRLSVHPWTGITAWQDEVVPDDAVDESEDEDTDEAAADDFGPTDDPLDLPFDLPFGSPPDPRP